MKKNVRRVVLAALLVFLSVGWISTQEKPLLNSAARCAGENSSIVLIQLLFFDPDQVLDDLAVGNPDGRAAYFVRVASNRALLRGAIRNEGCEL